MKGSASCVAAASCGAGPASAAAATAGTHETSAIRSAERMREAYLVTSLMVSMKRPSRGRLARFRAQIAVIVTLLQLPAVVWLCARTHGPWPLLVAAALSIP